MYETSFNPSRKFTVLRVMNRDSRQYVLSRAEDGKYVLAQRFISMEGQAMYMRNSFAMDLDKLIELKDMLESAAKEEIDRLGQRMEKADGVESEGEQTSLLEDK